jgi:acyl-CoA synthetase (NDP forming)
MGFAGPIWPVHPTRESLHGLPCVRALSDLPGVPDAVFVGVNRHATVDVVAELAAMGAGGATLFASGWEEAGEAALQAHLVAAAGDMPVLGPNCYGVINYLDGALLWPDQHGGRRVERGVAILSQSSNIAVNLTMQRRGLPVAYVACLGNAAQTGLADLAGALLADERVTALGLYAEGIGDAGAFAAMAEAARAAGKGIVAIKSGKTPGARAAAASHTASLAGGGVASSAFLAACGVAEVATPAELLETLKLFHVHGPGMGRRLCAVACSGGEAGLTADLAGPMGLDLPPPSAEQRARLSATLGPLVTIANPLDYHTFIWGDGPRTTEVFATMLAGYDAGLYLIDPPRPDRCDPSSYAPALNAIEAAQAIAGRPALPVASLPENLPEAMAEAMIARGLAPMMGIETTLAAVRAAQTPAGRPGWRPLPARPTGPARLLPEDEAKAVLAEAGLAVPRGVVADDLHALGARAAVLARPLAVKGLGLAHKTEAGAVHLRVEPRDVAPIAGVTGYLAEEMVTDAVAEILIGAARDPVYGVTLTLGMGGVEAELLADTVTLIAPATAEEVAAALRRLRLWPRLDGYRGRPRADTGAAVEAALAVQGLIVASRRIVEVEVNPLMLRAAGAVAADALIRVEE